jgi:hypothetical protein
MFRIFTNSMVTHNYLAVLRCAMLCCAVLCHALPCCAVRCLAIPCCAVPRRAVLRFSLQCVVLMQLAAAGGKDGVADLADALPAEVPPSADSVKNPSTQWGAVADDPIINPQTADWENKPQVISWNAALLSSVRHMVT